MKKPHSQTGKYTFFVRPQARSSAPALGALLLMAVFLGCAGVLMLLSGQTVSAQSTEPAATVSAAQAEEPTSADSTAAPLQHVVTATGNNAESACKASYTVRPQDASAENVVAAAGKHQLTNGMLQILYLSQVNAYRDSEQTIAPDFSVPLEYQLCPLTDGLSWQHYFLEKAIRSWQAQQAALFAAAQPRPITEEGYNPYFPADFHREYLSPDLPVNDFLYQDLPCYSPNRMHQSYLDSLGDVLDSLAAEAGFASLEDMAQSTHISAQSFLQAARDYNTAYMFFTEESYDIAPTDMETITYLNSSEEAFRAFDTGEETVDIRHILLLPKGAVTAADHTVSAAEDQWAQTINKAHQILSEWKKASVSLDPESQFARLANKYSCDGGSSVNGGYYCRLRPGQLIAPLDEWCFANGRKAGDTAIIRSEYGVHILYLSAIQESRMTNARDALACQEALEEWKSWMKAVPLTPDYSAAELWVDTTISLPSLEDTLYPDIAHERFPEVMVYFQQDYYYYPYCFWYIGPNGCGITAFAMLSTYMTDSLQTPAMMARRFNQYYDSENQGTNGDLFIHAPAEMGFYYDKLSFNLDEVIQALKNGQMVISRQLPGHFTDAGHYLLIQRYNEEDDTFQVRDSNIYVYKTLAGHKADKFTRANILSGGTHFYIMQPKVTSIPGCQRCGGHAAECAALLEQNYSCEKCAAALSRRNHFLSILEELSQ